MAEMVYLECSLNGESLTEVENATTTQDMGGDAVGEMIELTDFQIGMDTPAQQGGFQAALRHQMKPAYITFRGTGKTWPQWFKACDRNEEFEGTFYFYRPALGGGEEQLGTMTITRGRVISVDFVSPSTVDPEQAGLPPYLRVGIAWHSCEFISTEGTSHIVAWTTRR